MNLRQFGSTPLQVSPIGLGLAALGRPGYINLEHGKDLGYRYDVGSMTLRAHDLLDMAYDAGIRYFDVARSYGRAEQIMASWLMERQLAPEQLVLGSKWGYTYTAGWKVEAEQHEVKDHSLPVLQAQLLTSVDILGKHLDLYQIHSATIESEVLENIGILHELARVRDSGMTIGLSLSGPNQAATLEAALQIKVGGRLLFGSVQATWNILERSIEQLLRQAHEAGLAVIVKEALANGLLTDRSQLPAFTETKKRLIRLAAEMNCTIDALALAFVLRQPWLTTVLSGAVTIAQLHSNLAALELRWDQALDKELDALQEPADLYWQRRSGLPWN